MKQRPLHQVYLDIGSNIDKYHHIQSCIDQLCQDYPNIVFSNAYESEAVGFDGDPFINISAGLQTDLDYAEFNAYLKRLEDKHARKRDGKQYISRTLDVDILLFDDLVLHPDIDVPRAEIFRFPFVLFPLAEIASSMIHPVTKQTIAQIVEESNLDRDTISKVTHFPDLTLCKTRQKKPHKSA